MRVLWVSMNASLYDQALKRDNYGGGGWIFALQQNIMRYAPWIELGITFLYPKERDKVKLNGVIYYPLKEMTYCGFAKLLYYWKDYKNEDLNVYLPKLQKIVDDFKPDVVHVWGVENLLGCACLLKNVPVVAHLQGFLSLYRYTYYPYGMNNFTFKWKKFSIHEWTFNNGIIFGEHRMAKRAENEIQNLQSISNVMGRTEWDKDVALYNNPNVNYFHVDEMLRKEFYIAKKWNKKREDKFVVFSTISETLYKGVDLILKTAANMKEYGYFDFEWHVAGVFNSSEFTSFFEKHCHIKASDVNVKFLGSLCPDRLVYECQSADLYVHPSYIDNSPNSLCEAQLLGLPIIATNVGGINSLVKNRVTGILVPPNAPVNMAMAIKDCHDNETYWKNMAEKGMIIAEKRHNPQKIIKDLLGVYNTICNYDRK